MGKGRGGAECKAWKRYRKELVHENKMRVDQEFGRKPS